MTPLLVILSAPSGGGKTTIARAIEAARSDIAFSVSATTRAPREGEVDGVDYHFLAPAAFQRKIDEGEFLEWAVYNGHRYGTLCSTVDAELAAGRHVMLDIEVQGARAVRARRSNVLSIFILPPTAGALVERLSARRTEGTPALRARILRAVEELEEAVEYDYLVVNREVDRAVAQISGILDAESLKTSRLPDPEGTLRQLREALAGEAEALAHQSE